jgi:hypothetical protein
MKKAGPLCLAVVCVACSGAVTTRDGGALDPTAVHNESHVNGSLRLELQDYPTNAGIFFALPSVIAGDGNIVVENTRYGSLCRFAVDGHADQAGNTIGLHISFVERLTLCTQEIRALKYTATLTEPPGTYDVLVIHEDGTSPDTLVRRTVTVR